MARYKTPLRYGYDVYVPNYDVIVDKISEADARREYTRLRDIAQKRLKRLAASEWNQSQAYLENREGFRRLSDITTTRMFAREFSDLARFVNAPTSTITGQKAARQRAIDTLNASGVNIRSENWHDFQQFIDEFKDYITAGLFSSKQTMQDVADDLNEGGAIEDIMDRYYNYVRSVIPDEERWENFTAKEKAAFVERIQFSKD